MPRFSIFSEEKFGLKYCFSSPDDNLDAIPLFTDGSPREKTRFGVSDKVRLKPVSSATEIS